LIADSAGAGNRRFAQRRAAVSVRESLAKARHAFRIWRRTRPFWGGLLVIIGASEMLASEQRPLPVVARIGIRGLGGYLTPTFMVLCGLLLWLTPIARTYHSLLVILLAADSWLTANLGGFYIGMLTSLVGGALAFAWRTDADYRSPRRFRGRHRIRLPSWATEKIARLTERRALRNHPWVTATTRVVRELCGRLRAVKRLM
jgi:hypothetical protein